MTARVKRPIHRVNELGQLCVGQRLGLTGDRESVSWRNEGGDYANLEHGSRSGGVRCSGDCGESASVRADETTQTQSGSRAVQQRTFASDADSSVSMAA